MSIQIREQTRLIHTIYQDLMSVKQENGQIRYQSQASFLVYRIPWFNYPTKSKSSTFKISLSDLSDSTKQDLMEMPRERAYYVLKEAVAMVFCSLGARQPICFESRVKEELEVELID